MAIRDLGILKFKEHQKIEFSSDRKRMTVCVSEERDPEKIFVMTKGADSVIFERSDEHEQPEFT